MTADAHITTAGTSAREGCSLQLKESQRTMEHLTQDGRKSMVEYGRGIEGGRGMLGVLTAELIWIAILTIVEGEEL
jgi:hypothetical protein